MKNLEAERARIREISLYEEKYYSLGVKNIAGVDEVGRGPLCGPVTAACVILRRNEFIPYLNDSKKLSEKRREVLFDEITEKAVAYSVFSVSPEVIDSINILEATKLAMKNAVAGLSVPPDVILADAVTIPGTDVLQEAIIHGDALSVSIAAASIVAKVTRDRFMLKMAEVYPGYGFEKNKGYGTKEHIEAIRTYGLLPMHRRSFCGRFANENH